MRRTTTKRMQLLSCAAAMVIAVGLTGCVAGSSPSEPVGDASTPSVTTGQFGGEQLAIGDPVQGGELTWGVWAPIQALDPAGVMGDSIYLAMKAIYGSLTTATPDGGVALNLADSLGSDDNIVWTMGLDPDVTFTDGTPLNADAVIAHAQNVAAEGSSSVQAGEARQITGMRAVDPFTVEFTLAKPNNQFGLLFADNSLGMIPSPTAKAAAGADFAVLPVGAGPFTVTSFTPGSEVVLAKNPDYKFASDGLPYLDKITLKTVQEESSRRDAVRAGSLDGGTVASGPSLDEARNAGLTGLEQPVYSGFYLVLNHTHGALSDIRVRTALNHAIDRAAVNQVVYEGLHQPMDGVLVPTHPYADDDGDWPQFDPDAAQELIEAYKADAGVDDLSLTMTIVPGGDNAQVAPLVQQMLQKIGISAEIETQDQTALVGKFAAAEFDVALITRTIQAETTTALAQHFGTGSTRNYSHVSIPELDAAFARAASATSDSDRLKVIPDILDILAEQRVIVPIVSSGAGRILGDRVAGFPDGDPTARTIEHFDLSHVWVAE